MSELCDAFEVSPSGYFASLHRPLGTRAKQNNLLLEQINDVHQHRHTRCYGSPRMTHELLHRGLPCSVNRVARLMRQTGIKASGRRPYRPKTTVCDADAIASPNHLLEVLPPTAPAEQLVSDITYIPTRHGWLYLTVIVDLFSRAILGWKLADSLHACWVVEALRQAMDTGLPRPGTLFHSDRGCQHTAKGTRILLARYHLVQSMSAKGNCCHNAFAESIFASIKAEMLPQNQVFETKGEASAAVFDYIETFYNRKRLHSSLGYRTPQNCLKEYSQSQKLHLN